MDIETGESHSDLYFWYKFSIVTHGSISPETNNENNIFFAKFSFIHQHNHLLG